MTRKQFTAIMLVPILFLTACTPSTLISTLEAVVSAAEIALPVIGAAAGLPPQVSVGIVQYLQTVDGAIVQASTILAGPGTSAQKSAQIVQAFASIAAGCNCIPPGTPSVIVNVVNAVAQAVGRFLANFPQRTANESSRAPSAPLPEIKVGRSDRAALSKIRSRAVENMANVKGVVKP